MASAIWGGHVSFLGEPWIASAEGGVTLETPVELDAGDVVFVTARCGHDCDGLSALVLTPEGNVVSTPDPEPDGGVNLTFIPRHSGAHVLSVTPKRCLKEPCQVGVQLLRSERAFDTSPKSPVAHLVR